MPRRADSSIKNELFFMGRNISIAFLKANDLEPVVEYRIQDCNGNTGYCDRRGMPRRTRILVDVPVTAFPVKIPVCCNRSYPGHKIDRTALGVVAHETGHHVEFLMADKRKFNYKQWRAALANTRKQVSGYEPNIHEAFAETMRLFILNPSLLLAGCPDRYNFIRSMGLKPIEKRQWVAILPQSYWKDCNSWIAKQ